MKCIVDVGVVLSRPLEGHCRRRLLHLPRGHASKDTRYVRAASRCDSPPVSADGSESRP